MNESELITLDAYLNNLEIEGGWFALIDTAFEPKKIKKLIGARGCQLYAGTELEEYDELSPLIIEVKKNGDSAFLQSLLRVCEGKPMLGFINSNRDIKELKQHLEYLHFVVSDEKSWMLRFADTRISESLFQILNPQQKDILFNPINCWLYLNRQDTWQAQLGKGLGPLWVDAPKEMLAFTDQQFAALLEQSEPDTLLSQLQVNFPDLLNKYSNAVSYQLACISVKEAREMQLESQQNDVLVLAVLWFMYGEGLDLRCEYLDMKKSIKQGVLLQDAIAEIPAAFFEEMDMKN
ncbi:DUF4123 domain-containing protein [Iodobacter sp. HSC-16F04]|uniref:DUF4123 domain-containing protein n=1 Tax=Iodobacter violaceini TaxID=3044271 RepID=A0ABX0L2V0_9NEIS|nr:DUF4123 domain-containing protein [Iodobacter violacea]NHQ88529.1 DUF4123 domain-containing protein [Iodobacter violacea]